MAKKKTIDLRSVDPTPVPAGDVNIIYNGTRIGGFSEDTEAVLKTAGCRAEYDIHVNYTKSPSGIPVGNTINFTNNTSGTVSVLINRGSMYDNTGGAISPISIAPNSTSVAYAFSGSQNEQYYITLTVESATDQYSITTGSTAWEYDSREQLYGYSATDASPITGQTYNVVIADKE